MPDSSAARPQREASAPEPSPSDAKSALLKGPAGPTLLAELEPRHRVFFRNLGDLLFHREPPPFETSTQPASLRPDYFIRTGISWVRFLESYAGHIAFIAAVYLFCTLPFFNRAPKLISPFENAKIEYHPVSEYLPPINTGIKQQMKSRVGQPKLAKQEILSVPPEADNKQQTVVTPPKVKLTRDVALPNIVAWTPVPAAQPIAASSRATAQLKVPQFEPQVVGPTADVSQVKPKLLLPPELHPSVLEPVLSPEQLKLQHGNINIAQAEPQVAAPKLPVPAQRASGAAESKDTSHAAAVASGPKEVPPSPNVQNLPASQGQGQLIALGLNPADVHGPVSAPSGNRSGEFHASPGGKADAPGTPNIVGTGSASSSGSGGSTKGLPPGLVVGAPPAGATTSAVAGTPGGAPAKPAAAVVNPDLEARKRIIAAAMKPTLTLPSIHDRPVSPPPTLSEDPDASIEQRVFGRKRYYSLVMNMPNLTSATGSWIIRFAELKQTEDKSALVAPVATLKVDPAYPPDVLRDKVEGTVTLYAIIREDGTVADIKVLDSLDSRLDDNAVSALSRWRFRPGTKNGAPVAVEAVVQIPFQMRHLR
jgi:TonB family protein